MRQRATLIFLAVSLVALLPALWSIFSPFATGFVLAGVLAIMVHPIHNWIAARVRSAGRAAALTTLLTLVLLLVPLSLAGVALTQELRVAYLKLTERSLDGTGIHAIVLQSTDRVLTVASTYLPIDKETLREEMVDKFKGMAGSMLGIAGAAFGGVTSILFTGILVVALLYVIIRYGHAWIRSIPSLLILDEEATAAIFSAVHDTIIANVNGLLVVAAVQGTLLGIGFLIVGLPSPVTWGLIGSLCSLIPVVGIMVVWVPFVIGLLVMQHYWLALILTFWCTVIVGTSDNLVRPLVVGERVNQHPMLIILSIIGGTTVFGAIGLLLGPVIVSLAIALAGELRKRVPVGPQVHTP